MARDKTFLIVDGSGSMSGVQNDVVGGLNQLIKEQAADDPKSKLSLTIFDTSVVQKIVDQPVGEIAALTSKDTFLGGCTALNDAVGATLKDVENKNLKGKKLVVIYTDGQENSSKEWTNAALKDLITSLQDKGDWTITFMSADVDNFAHAQAIGVPAGNYMKTNSANTGQTFSAVSAARHMHSAAPVAATENFFESYDVQDKIDEAVKVPKKKILTPA